MEHGDLTGQSQEQCGIFAGDPIQPTPQKTADEFLDTLETTVEHVKNMSDFHHENIEEASDFSSILNSYNFNIFLSIFKIKKREHKAPFKMLVLKLRNFNFNSRLRSQVVTTNSHLSYH